MTPPAIYNTAEPHQSQGRLPQKVQPRSGGLRRGRGDFQRTHSCQDVVEEAVDASPRLLHLRDTDRGLQLPGPSRARGCLVTNLVVRVRAQVQVGPLSLGRDAVVQGVSGQHSSHRVCEFRGCRGAEGKSGLHAAAVGAGRVLRRSRSRRGLVHGLPQRRAHLDVAQLVQVALEVDDQIQVAGLLLVELALQNTHKYIYTRTRKRAPSAGGAP